MSKHGVRLPSPKHALKPSCDGLGADTFAVCPLRIQHHDAVSVREIGGVAIHGAIAEGGSAKIRQRLDAVPIYRGLFDPLR